DEDKQRLNQVGDLRAGVSGIDRKDDGLHGLLLLLRTGHANGGACFVAMKSWPGWLIPCAVARRARRDPSRPVAQLRADRHDVVLDLVADQVLDTLCEQLVSVLVRLELRIASGQLQETEAFALDQLGRHAFLAPDVTQPNRLSRPAQIATTRLTRIDATENVQAAFSNCLSSRSPTSAGMSALPITTALRSARYFHLAPAARESHHSTYLSQR